MKCPHCGAQLRGGEEICPRCRRRLAPERQEIIYLYRPAPRRPDRPAAKKRPPLLTRGGAGAPRVVVVSRSRNPYAGGNPPPRSPLLMPEREEPKYRPAPKRKAPPRRTPPARRPARRAYRPSGEGERTSGAAVVILLAAVLLALMALFGLIRLLRGGRTPEPAVTPSPAATEMPEMYTVAPLETAPAPDETTVPEPVPTEAPAAAEAQPVRQVRGSDDLIELMWWMVRTGTDYADLDAISMTREQITETANLFSNYFTQVAYEVSPAHFRAEFKPGLRMLLAIQSGSADGLTAEEQKAAKQAQSIVDGLISPGMTDAQKERAIHDYICAHCEYLQTVKGYNAGNALGFLQNGLCTCAGYVDSFRLLAKLAGLDVEMIGGPTDKDAEDSKGHAWNLIRLDGLWYVVDVTWDDMLASGAACEHAYYNLPLNALSGSREWDPAVCPEGRYAEKIDSRYFYAAPEYAAASREEGLQLAVRQLDATGTAFIYFTGADEMQSVSADLAAHYGKKGSRSKPADELRLPLYKFTK